jgi:hypothetical protein
MSKKEPQAAIVSIEDLKEIEGIWKRNSARSLLKLAREVHEILKDEKLPHDLASRHDHYLWEEE